MKSSGRITPSLRRRILVTPPGGVATQIENDALGRPGRITDSLGGQASYTYGPFGGLWTVTDPGGAIRASGHYRPGPEVVESIRTMGTRLLKLRNDGDIAVVGDCPSPAQRTGARVFGDGSFG